MASTRTPQTVLAYAANGLSLKYLEDFAVPIPAPTALRKNVGPLARPICQREMNGLDGSLSVLQALRIFITRTTNGSRAKPYDGDL